MTANIPSIWFILSSPSHAGIQTRDPDHRLDVSVSDAVDGSAMARHIISLLIHKNLTRKKSFM